MRSEPRGMRLTWDGAGFSDFSILWDGIAKFTGGRLTLSRGVLDVGLTLINAGAVIIIGGER